jgi:hypothetical protein
MKFRTQRFPGNVRRISALVSVALLSGVAFAANAEAPKVTWRSPLSGATLSGTINGSTCAVDATSTVGMDVVSFWIDNYQIQNDYSAPFNCAFDTKMLSDGPHTMMVQAYNTRRELTTSSIPVTINNTATTTAPAPAPVTTIPSGTAVATPAPTAGSLGIWFKAPANGATVSGTLNLGTNCYVKGTGSIARVDFFVDATSVGTDSNAADGMQCLVDTTKFANGAHQLKAVAVSAGGSTDTDIISINIQNAATTPPVVVPPAGTNQAPTVSFVSPTASQTVSGTVAYSASAADDKAVTKVVFMADTTTLATKTAAPWSGSLDTKTLPNGSHKLIAIAYDAEGLSTTAQVAVNVNNTATSSLPAGGKAVPTFHSIGLYWTPKSNPGAAGCSVQYKKSSDSAWKPGLSMWYDARNSECRGSLVMLDPGQSYDVQMGTGSTYAVQTSAQTWSEQFPIARTVTLPAGTVTQPLAITQGGVAGGYVLYQANPAGTTIDVQNAYPNNVTISAPYVILRGVTLKGGQINGVELKQGAHDVVIEGNDISNWGRFSNTSGTAWNGFAGWDIGVDMDAGIRASCTDLSLERVVIQRNKIHDPRYGANSWDWGHPSGPQGITFSFCGGNNVFRYNEITSSDYKHFFNDGIGGEDNFTQAGFPNYDSDIYGNIIRGAMDDGLEIEGGDKNVRVWGNYLDQTGTGIATTVAAWGPVYIFRNVYDRSRMKYITAPDLNDDRGPFFKSGTQDSTIGNGRRYVFHNTSLQAAGASFGLGAGGGLQGTSQPLTNTVSRNNIFNIWKSNWPSMDQGSSGNGNDFNNDLYNGSMNAGTGAEASGAKGTPTYQSGSGVGMSGMYQLAPSSLGYGKGAPIPNFNDAYGSPDMGAHQSGTPAMKFGVNQ